MYNAGVYVYINLVNISSPKTLMSRRLSTSFFSLLLLSSNPHSNSRSVRQSTLLRGGA